MINFKTMTADELSYYSKFSFEKFLNETAKLSEKSVEDLREKFGGPPNCPSKNDLWYVIQSEGQPVGFIWIQIQPKKKEAFIYDFYIEVEYRFKGLGRETLVRGIELMKKRPIDKVRLCVFHDNAIARKLYSSLGFKETDFNPERRQYTLEFLL